MNKVSQVMQEPAGLVPMDHKIAPSLERRRLRAYVILMLMDAVLLHLSFALAGLIYEGQWWEPRNMLAATTLLPLFFTIALYNKSYCARALSDWLFAARQALVALVISATLLNFVAFYTKSNAQFSRVSVTIGLVLAAIAFVALRRIMAMVVNHFWAGGTLNRLIIKDGGAEFDLDGAVTISAAKYDLDPTSHDPFMLDRLGRLLQNQDKVVVSCPRERREAWAFLLKSTGVYGEIVSEPAHALGARAVHRYLDQERTTLVVSHGPLGLRARVSKRVFDLAFGGAAVIALIPLFVVIAALIKLEDGGPVFFAQRRLGRGNQFFRMLKFRSMRVEKNDANGDLSTGRDDDRITRIGKFIRRTSIDELPQLLNVLRGDMSIVGPRPHAMGSRANNKFFWEVDAQYWLRHSLKPGLTGLAQVRGHRGATEKEADLINRLKSDLEYIGGWSLRRDMAIIVRTIGVLNHENAY